MKNNRPVAYVITTVLVLFLVIICCSLSSYIGSSRKIVTPTPTIINIKNTSIIAKNKPTFTPVMFELKPSQTFIPTSTKFYLTQQPTEYWPEGANALCKDGQYSFSKTRSGTCSDHHGVEKWR